MRAIRWTSATGNAMIAGSPVVAMLAVAIFASCTATMADADPPSIPPSISPSGLPDSLLNTISSTTATETQRRDAAVELVGLDSPQAHASVTKGLAKDPRSEGRTALMVAITSASSPDVGWIEPLGALLGINPDQTQAAAQALANYRGNDRAFNLLKNFADSSTNPTEPRVRTIRAMGALIDKEPAQWLINLVGNSAASLTLRRAATDALAEMTGITSFGTNAQKWQQWWNSAAGLNARDFHALLLESRGREAAQFQQLQEAAIALLRGFYSDAPDDAKKAEVVLKYLDSDSPVIRLAAVNLVSSMLALHPPTQQVKDRLVDMIGDADETVRTRVVETLKDSTKHDDYPKLLPKLISRLDVEKSAQVRIMIATALGKFGLPTAGDAIQSLLTDPDQAVATAAATALAGNLGHNLRGNRKIVDALAGVLRGIIKNTPSRPGADELRAACVSALEALDGDAAFQELFDFIRPNELPEVRKAALQGLADIGNSNAMDRIASILDERDPAIRLEAARAMGPVASPVDDQKFFVRITNERDPDVALALWTSLQKLYDKLQPPDLATWADRFNNPPLKDPDKRLATLIKLGDAYKASGAPDAATSVARNQQDIALAMMEVAPPQTAGAIKNLSDALKYWRDSGKGTEVVLNGVIEDLLTDRLKAGQYVEGTKFAAEQIAIQPANQQVLGPIIKNEADRLSRTGNLADKAAAKSLIDEALKMNPPLDRFVGQLQQIQANMDRR